MQSITTYWAVALCLGLSAMTANVLAQEEAAEPTQAEPAGDTATAPVEEEAAPAMDMPMLTSASKEDVSFAIGYSIGADMAQRGADFNTDQLTEGLRAGLGEIESRLTQEQIAQSLFSFQMQMQQKMMEQAKESLAKGQAYLDANAQKEGVKVTESGLQYKVLTQGDGATPTLDDVVQARYKGSLIDGTVFDQSEGDETVSFPVARVIEGWVEALQMMKVGDKWELTIPSNLAYGEMGSPQGAIGPNEVLVFEIELVGIDQPAEQE